MAEKSLEELKETFRHFDKDDNGSIDRAEFGALLKALGHDCDAEELESGLAILDTNNNGLIEFNEFVNWFNNH